MKQVEINRKKEIDSSPNDFLRSRKFPKMQITNGNSKGSTHVRKFGQTKWKKNKIKIKNPIGIRNTKRNCRSRNGGERERAEGKSSVKNLRSVRPYGWEQRRKLDNFYFRFLLFIFPFPFTFIFRSLINIGRKKEKCFKEKKKSYPLLSKYGASISSIFFF